MSVAPVGELMLTQVGDVFLVRVNAKRRRPHAVFLCDCGRRVVVASRGVVRTRSCGCLVGNCRGSHGLSQTTTYRSWSAMKQRCYNSLCENFKYHGGRGIKVCEQWHEFKNFHSDMGSMPDGLTLERIDNEKGYCPDNCTWATHKEQQRNTRRNVNLTVDGVTQAMSAWAEQVCIPYTAIKSRHRRGWPDRECVYGRQKGQDYGTS